MRLALIGMLLAALGCAAWGQEAHSPATQQAIGKFPHVTVDVKARQVRVECEALAVDAPLEFFCCVKGSNEHESVLRTEARPSDVHTGLLMLGLKGGRPVRYSEAESTWLAPEGPALAITVEYEKEGKTIAAPACRWMRNVKTKQEIPPMNWVFAGSRIMPDGNYAADVTGYLVSIVNFELTVIDVPQLASSANETLQWERNAELVPAKGTKVIMVITPVGKE